jgi:predicted SAM-dependent methyltransferase
MRIELYEPVSDERFSEMAYLLANPDVQSAGIDPLQHFRKHGRREGRRQINRDLIDAESPYRRAKFERFRGILDIDSEVVRFPARSGTRHLKASDYKMESANIGFGPFVNAVENNPSKLFVDIGCGLRPFVQGNCLYIDVYPSITVDLIVEATCRYPIKSNSVDGVGCFAVLEHTRQPWVVAEEIYRMLRPGGAVFIDWPFLQPVHGYPSHYFNATRDGLLSLFTDLGIKVDTIDTFSNQTPDHTVNWVLGKLVRDIPDARLRKRVLSMSVRELLACGPGSELWNQILAVMPHDMRSEFACGNSLIGRKPLDA